MVSSIANALYVAPCVSGLIYCEGQSAVIPVGLQKKIGGYFVLPWACSMLLIDQIVSIVALNGRKRLHIVWLRGIDRSSTAALRSVPATYIEHKKR
jgi:hypothetical protein